MQFQQLHHSEAVHADPDKLRQKILKDLAGPTGPDTVDRLLTLAKEQQLERDHASGS